MRRIALLGATGSIGTQVIDVVRRLPNDLQIVSMSAHRSAEKLQKLGQELGVARLALLDEKAALQSGLSGGLQALIDQATADDVDMVVVAVAGVIGLHPTLAAIEAGKKIALASKEVLVAAGEIVMPLIQKQGVQITPIDSEHSAIFQSIQGYNLDQIDHITLTASGGPFRGKSRSELAQVTVEQALNHPTWRMGGKITIDSATLMNKALEMIEAKWLFGLSMDQVKVVVHPQSVVHSLVTFKDGSALGQLGWPDMRLPIQYALVYPNRIESQLPPWDPTQTPQLSFESVDEDTFSALQIAREATARGGTTPAAFNAANEAAVASFFEGKLGFLDIVEAVKRCVECHEPSFPSLEAIEAADAQARQFVSAYCKN